MTHPYTGPPRFLGAVRLSVNKDATTSPERQREHINATRQSLGGVEAGWATDLDVSAVKVRPEDRPELGEWLRYRSHEFDGIIWARLDRAVRSMADMADLGRWAKEHRKRLVFAVGPGGGRLELDMASPVSELIMMVLAFAAQMEAQAIQERTAGAAAYMRNMGRWPGGRVPYGYVPSRKVFADGNEGWWLSLHEETAHIRRQMVARAIVGGESGTYSAITRWLQVNELITPANHRAQVANPPREMDPESKWNVTSVRELLRDQIMRGWSCADDGTVIRTDDGSPVLCADALLDDDTWYELRDALRFLTMPSSPPRRADAHPLLGVIVCGVCEANMHHNWYRHSGTGEQRHTYRCVGKTHESGIKGQTILQEHVDTWVEDQFLAHMGPFRRTQVVRSPGVDHRPEIAELDEAINELSSRLATLRGAAADAVTQQLQGRSDRKEELERQPYAPPREEVVELDETWAEAWNASDGVLARRAMLLEVGARVVVMPAQRVRAPVDERLSFHLGTHVDPEADALEDVLYLESR
ncbi:recombinase family protein [Streptomyces sp. NPDC056549]|uniref:recombinase family protein n=1 Tax=Streptomyces sp. NPDC056549 TaxID=3345864 RepID=UPI0036BB6BFB